MKALLFFILVSSSPMILALELEKPQVCLATREYVTSLEYLREHKAFGIPEKEARELSNKIAKGCTGASKRFIQITDLLVKADVPSKKALEIGLKFSNSTDEATSAFFSIFKGAYLESLLDLNASEALNVAMELSVGYQGNKSLAEKQFNKLVHFCVDKKSLDLPLVECARLSTRVIKQGDRIDFNIGDDFIELFNYLTKQSGANRPSFEALKTSEYVTGFGPEARKNFVSAYEYGLSKKGLDLSIQAATDFGKSMAAESIKK